MFELVIACLLLSLLEMDTTYLGQFLFSRPTCVGAIMGYLCGDFFLGLQLGVFTELLLVDFMPIGGVVPPSGAICAGIAVILSCYFAVSVYFAFFIGLLVSLLFSYVEKLLRKFRSRILPAVEKQLVECSLTPAKLLTQSFVLEYLTVFTFVLTLITILGPLFFHIREMIPQRLHVACQFSYFLVPWIGLAMMFVSFSNKQKAD